MLLPPTLLLLTSLHLATSHTPPPQHIFSNPSSPSLYHIPTIHESAILARRILNLSSIATLSTVFPTSHTPSLYSQPSPDNSPQPLWGTPNDLSGNPIGLMDYYATCPSTLSNPTLLAISIATTFRNTHSGSNATLSLRWHPPASAPPSGDIYTYSPANMPRFSLIGYIEPIPAEELEGKGGREVEKCFLDRHPDAEAWLPGNAIHESWWGRLVVQEIYWIGGFGDRAFIGWIPKGEWEGVTEVEVEGTRLIGEEAYEAYIAREVDGVGEL